MTVNAEVSAGKEFRGPGSANLSPAMDREEILRKLRERILTFAASRVPRDIAEDLTQEVLLLLSTKYADKSDPADLVPLAFRIVRFMLTAHIRKAKRRGEHLVVSIDEVEDMLEGNPVMDSPEVRLRRVTFVARLETAILKLDGRCRHVMMLKLQGKSFADIKQLLAASSINTVYTWDARCRRRLLDLMGGSWES